ncbi:hypothetical protein [Lysobacter sp. P5_B9]
MSIVQFLETLGAAPNQMSAANYTHAVEALGLDDAARDALLARDANAVNRVLGGRAELRCFIATPD